MEADHIIRGHQDDRSLSHGNALHDDIPQVGGGTPGRGDQCLPAKRVQAKRLQEAEQGDASLFVPAVDDEYVLRDVVSRHAHDGRRYRWMSGVIRRRRALCFSPGDQIRGLGRAIGRDVQVAELVIEAHEEVLREMPVVSERSLRGEQLGAVDDLAHVEPGDIRSLAQFAQVCGHQPGLGGASAQFVAGGGVAPPPQGRFA